MTSTETTATTVLEGNDVVTRKQTFALGPNQHQIRIAGPNENLWFVAKDVGDALGIKNMRDALKNYKDGKEKGVASTDTHGGKQKLLVMSERAVYKFINRSDKPEAEPFQDWVAEVLHTIRVAGRYELQTSSQKLLQDAETARLAAETARLAAEKEAKDADTARLAAEKEAKEAKEALEKERLEKEDLKRRLKNKHQRGHCVYLLRNPADRERNLWKIGRSKDLSKRECQYQTPLPDGVDIAHCRHTSDSKLAESLVHHALSDYRYTDNKEWFEGDPEVFAHVVDVAVAVIDNLPFTVASVVQSKLRDKIRREFSRARRFDLEDGNETDASNSSIVINANNVGTVNVTIQKPGQAAFDDFFEQHIIEERRAGLRWTTAYKTFRRWAEDETRAIPNTKKEIQRIFVGSLGRAKKVNMPDGQIFGWQHYRLEGISPPETEEVKEEDADEVQEEVPESEVPDNE